MEELTIIKGQLGIMELVSCRRASNRDFVDVSRTWVFSIGRYLLSCRTQILALIVSVYSTVCTFKTGPAPCVQSNLRQGT